MPCAGDSERQSAPGGDCVGRCASATGHRSGAASTARVSIRERLGRHADLRLRRWRARGGCESGGWAHAIAITPDGRWVYVANFLDDTLAVFDSDTLARVALLPTEPYPHGLDISPDGRYAIATGFSSGHLRLYDAQAHGEIARIEVGLGSSHSVFLNDQDTAFVGCSVGDHVACVDLAARGGVVRLRLDA